MSDQIPVGRRAAGRPGNRGRAKLVAGAIPGCAGRVMPEVFRHRGHRFFFFSDEGREPVQVHVEKAEAHAKFWLLPVVLAENRGFRAPELRSLHNLIEEHQERIIFRWHEHFGP